MKKHILLLLINLMIFSSLSIAQKRFVLENPATDRFQIYDHIDSAINNLQEGDLMTIPGGIYYPTGNWIVDKENVSIIGRGFFEDSTTVDGPTKILGSITIAASGVRFEGLNISLDVNTSSITGGEVLQDIVISRCRVRNINLGGTVTEPGTSNITVQQSIIRGTLNGGYTQSALILNNIIESETVNFNGTGGVVFRNNYFARLVAHRDIRQFTSVNNCVFERNIFNTSSIGWSSFFVGSDQNIGNNNSLKNSGDEILEKSVDGTNIFYNSYPILTFFDGTNNYPIPSQIEQGASDPRLATDEPAVGPFAGPNAVPAGWVPRGPHIQSAQIATETDAEGKLQINIKVRAQQN